ncbi:beta-glucosidase BglX [Maribacter sp. 2307ULW6-5]|uniref:beta-glucosidase BglX n=1 Tax=Maribacter sp. 2307ULW6-5 TaxID=3386275 RepID=UPI0039BD69DA
MKHLTLCLSLSFFALNAFKGIAQTAQADQIKALIAQMTLEEKVGQMNLYNGFFDVTGPAPSGNDGTAIKYEHLKKGWVGAMLNVNDPAEIRKLQTLVVEESRLGIPMLFGFDVIHGYKTQAPIPLAEAASWDLEAIERSAALAAKEAAAVGLNWTFAPMVDISRDARWGRVMEGAGEDPFLGAKIAKARVSGFQGDDLAQAHTIAACAKHFAAYGFAESGRDYNTVDMGNNTLYNMVLPPFEAAVEEDVASFMNAFNILNGIPATGSTMLQRDILKEKWKFKGFMVSDWASISEMETHGFAKDLKESAQKAAVAGSDMDMESHAYIAHLANLVREGAVSESILDEAVGRILKVKYDLGLFEDPYRYCNVAPETYTSWEKDHRAEVLEMAKKSIVLLKNEGELLPLKKTAKNILVLGDLADDKNSPLGSWRLGSDDHTAVSFLEGLSAYTDQYRFVQGPKVFNDSTDFKFPVKVNGTEKTGMEKAVAAAKNAAVVVMVLGEHGFMSGEGRSRTKLGLPGLQQELLKAVHAVNQNIVLVLMNGRPLTLGWEAENIPAILETWQLGSESGNAIAQVLFGDENPSGKLPMTFPRSVGQLPLYYNHYSTGRPDSGEMVFWSHFIDEENSPLFPFGHGLSYTQFQYNGLEVDASDKNKVKVKVTVTNTGDRFGEEVVQLYLQDPVASVVRPVKELKGFEKIGLAPKASQQLVFELTNKELGFYDQDYRWVVEPGQFNVMVGTDSQEGLTSSFTITP